jgi:hypothetical protein
MPLQHNNRQSISVCDIQCRIYNNGVVFCYLVYLFHLSLRFVHVSSLFRLILRKQFWINIDISQSARAKTDQVKQLFSRDFRYLRN